MSKILKRLFDVQALPAIDHSRGTNGLCDRNFQRIAEKPRQGERRESISSGSGESILHLIEALQMPVSAPSRVHFVPVNVQQLPIPCLRMSIKPSHTKGARRCIAGSAGSSGGEMKKRDPYLIALRNIARGFVALHLETSAQITARININVPRGSPR